jgi:hypothetical protein
VKQHDHVLDTLHGNAAFVVPAICAPWCAWLSRIALEGDGEAVRSHPRVTV